jgi:PAS domain S-box-containing protein
VRRVEWFRRLCWRLVWAIVVFVAATAAWPAAGPPEAAKRVLMVFAATRIGPGFATVQQTLVEALTKSPVPIDITVENLATERFPNERSQKIFNDYLLEKYGDQPPDLIVLVFIGNLELPVRALRNIFPRIPIIVTGQTDEPLRPEQLGAHVGGFIQRPSPAGTLDLILRLHPDLRRIVVIGGTSSADREVMTRVQEAAQSFADRVQIDYWTDLTYAQLQQRVIAMPPNTAILYTRFFRDAAGRGYASGQVGQVIGRLANVPVYVLSDPSLGEGAVGGSLVSVGKPAVAVAALARTLLEGASPENLPFEVWTDTIPTFDARALERWGIDERLLPPESVVRYRPVSIWQQYRGFVIGALILIALQSALIFALIVQRGRVRHAQAEVSESHEVIELAASAGGLGLWARDTQTDELWLNNVMRSLFHLAAGPVDFKDIVARIHPEDRRRVMADTDRMQQAGQAFEAEYRVMLPDGEQRWHLAKGHSITRADSHSTRRLGVVLDVTERKLAEERLRDSEENFRRLVESTAAVIWQADAKTWLFTYVGPQAVKLLGYPLEQWYEKDFWISHIHPEDREGAIATCLARSRELQDFQFDYRMVKADGTVVWIHDIVNCQPAQGQPAHLRGIMLDVTERKIAQQSLEAQRSFLHQVIDINPNFIFAKDREGRFTLANQALADAYGVTVDELIGRTDADFSYNMQEVEFFRKIDLEVLNTRSERFIGEERMTDCHGNVRWLQTVKRPIQGTDGVTPLVLGASTDITQRKQAELALQEQRAHMTHVARVSVMGELAASLAHELNQPLAAILSNAQAALRFMERDDVDLDEIREILQDIVTADRRAGEVIRHVRALVKKREAVLEFVPIDLADLVRSVLALVHSSAVAQNVYISVEMPLDLPSVRGDRVHLQQVVLNMLLNAFDAMSECRPHERAVTLRATLQSDRTVLVSISDRGPGLADGVLDKIFEPFYTTKAEGLGMGLSICRSIIELHDGRLWAENNASGGATFCFTLPVFDTTEPAAAG